MIANALARRNSGPPYNTGVVTTFAGLTTASSRSGTFRGLGTTDTAPIDLPNQLSCAVLMNDGNYIVSAIDNSVLYLINGVTGVFSIFAGALDTPGFVNATGSSARFTFPAGLSVIPSTGNLLVADLYNYAVRHVTYPGAVVTTLCGGTFGNTQTGTGLGAFFKGPYSIAYIPTSGKFALSDRDGNRIYIIDMSGNVTLLAGAGNEGFSDGNGTGAVFFSPMGISVDPATGNVYVGDAQNHMIRMVTPSGTASRISGSSVGTSGYTDAGRDTSRFNNPNACMFDPSSGNILIFEGNNYRIRSVTQSGTTTTIAGIVTARSINTAPTDGAFAQVNFSQASSSIFTLLSNGDILLPDDSYIRYINVAGRNISSLGFSGFTNPAGVVVDPITSNIVVCDASTWRIRRISPTGFVSTLAGSGSSGSADGTGIAASFSQLTGLTINPSNGNVTVLDGTKLRTITTAGVVTTIATISPNVLCITIVPSASGYVVGTTDSVKFVTYAGTVTTLATTSGNVRGVVLLSDGKLALVYDTTGAIRIMTTTYEPNSGVITEWTTLSGAYGIATLPNGSLSVSTTSGELYMIAYPSGSLTKLVASGLGATPYVASMLANSGIAVTGNNRIQLVT